MSKDMNELNFPLDKDVTRIPIEDGVIHAVTITEGNHSYLVNLALSMYTNEPCRICGTTITKDDLDLLVFAGYSQDDMARAAHGHCWERYPSLDKKTPRPEWVHQ